VQISETGSETAFLGPSEFPIGLFDPQADTTMMPQDDLHTSLSRPDRHQYEHGYNRISRVCQPISVMPNRKCYPEKKDSDLAHVLNLASEELLGEGLYGKGGVCRSAMRTAGWSAASNLPGSAEALMSCYGYVAWILQTGGSAAIGGHNMERMVHCLQARPSNSSFPASHQSGLEQEQEP
jgi:hypothetical protein